MWVESGGRDGSWKLLSHNPKIYMWPVRWSYQTSDIPENAQNVYRTRTSSRACIFLRTSGQSTCLRFNTATTNNSATEQYLRERRVAPFLCRASPHRETVTQFIHVHMKGVSKQYKHTVYLFIHHLMYVFMYLKTTVFWPRIYFFLIIYIYIYIYTVYVYIYLFIYSLEHVFWDVTLCLLENFTDVSERHAASSFEVHLVVTLQTRNGEVLGSNLCRDTGYHD
jgi:hypothetical protein